MNNFERKIIFGEENTEMTGIPIRVECIYNQLSLMKDNELSSLSKEKKNMYSYLVMQRSFLIEFYVKTYIEALTLAKKWCLIASNNNEKYRILK